MVHKLQVCFLAIITFSYAKIYDRCELAKELKYVHGFSYDELSTWLCIAQHESLLNTSAMNPGSGDHGLFQISQMYWCSPPGHGCNVACVNFRDDHIADDVKCVRKIFKEHQRLFGNGFQAWAVYPLYCKSDTMKYTDGCFENEIDNGIYVNPQEKPELPEEEEDDDDDGYVFPPLPSRPKVYGRCELARELKRVHKFPENQVSKWVCIVEHESNFNTSATNPGSGDHGLFQISEQYWCSRDSVGYGCNANCASFRDNNIADDVKCVRRIFDEHTAISGDGYDAWVVYPRYCRGDTSRYIDGCFKTHQTTDNILKDEEYEFPPLPNISKDMAKGIRFTSVLSSSSLSKHKSSSQTHLTFPLNLSTKTPLATSYRTDIVNHLSPTTPQSVKYSTQEQTRKFIHLPENGIVFNNEKFIYSTTKVYDEIYTKKTTQKHSQKSEMTFETFWKESSIPPYKEKKLLTDVTTKMYPWKSFTDRSRNDYPSPSKSFIFNSRINLPTDSKPYKSSYENTRSAQTTIESSQFAKKNTYSSLSRFSSAPREASLIIGDNLTTQKPDIPSYRSSKGFNITNSFSKSFHDEKIEYTTEKKISTSNYEQFVVPVTRKNRRPPNRISRRPFRPLRPSRPTRGPPVRPSPPPLPPQGFPRPSVTFSAPFTSLPPSTSVYLTTSKYKQPKVNTSLSDADTNISSSTSQPFGLLLTLKLGTLTNQSTNAFTAPFEKAVTNTGKQSVRSFESLLGESGNTFEKRNFEVESVTKNPPQTTVANNQNVDEFPGYSFFRTAFGFKLFQKNI